MERAATRRLIDAAASLGAADRALLNLWVNRGLDDAAVARMTGMEPGAIAERRGRIVTALSDELGLPPGDIAEAVGAMASSHGRDPDAAPVPAPEASDNGRPDEAQTQTEPDASLNGHAPDSVISATQTPEAEAEASAPQTTAAMQTVEAEAAGPQTTVAGEPADARAEPEASRSRRGRWAWLSLLLVAVAALAVVLITSGSDTKHHRTSTAARGHTAPAVTTPPTTPTPSPAVSRPQPDPLGALPGGASHARGSLVLSGSPNHLKLRLTVTGLPAAHAGHYEVWLYNTVIAAKPVARLRNGVRHLVIALPRRAARFHWVDVSFQPLGTIYHSGESVLRAANPARASARQLRSRLHRRRQLRRATSGSSSASTSK